MTCKNVFMMNCKYQAPFPRWAGESNVKAAEIPKQCLRVLAMCVSAIYAVVYVKPTLHMRAHTHTPLKACLYIYVDIYNLVL